MGGKKEIEPKPTIQREKLAGFIYDLAKLVFGGLVVGTLTPLVVKEYETVSIGVLIVGGIATVLLGYVANRLLKTR